MSEVRYAGLLPGRCRLQARVLAEQACEAVRAHVFDLGNDTLLRKTCSIGFTAFPLLPSQADKFSWEEAVELADQCLIMSSFADGRTIQWMP